jgi:acetoacetyl-CoA synthetase
VAVVGYSQTRERVTLTFGQLREQVRLARAGLRALGVGRGDRVGGYLPNIPEALVAYLAAISLGAVWACCAPEFGTKGVVDRLGQVEPTVLFAVDGYRYGEKAVDRRGDVADIRAALPSLRHTISVPYLGGTLDDTTSWSELLALGQAADEPLAFEAVPFDHPVSVLFT